MSTSRENASSNSVGVDEAVEAAGSGRVLVMTVGTGDRERLEETLYRPLLRSLSEGPWSRLTLLPSEVTEPLAREFANRARTRIPGLRVKISVLPPDAENDADRAYGHFDQVLVGLLRTVTSDRITIDFSRGTKAMSAAIVLAGARHAVRRLRYVEGDRDRRGMVRPDSERVRRIRTDRVDRGRRTDLARNHMGRGHFVAAADLLDGIPCAGAIADAARFYAAWDRLDYDEADRTPLCAEPPDATWRDLWPRDDMRDWVRRLRPGAARRDNGSPFCRERLRRLVVDLTANGERRVAQGQFEDALVRAYRVVELIGQVRLFDHGLDSSRLDPEHWAVKALKRKIRKKKQRRLSRNKDGTLQAARMQVARILKILEDPMAQDLLAFDDSKRNEKSLKLTRLRNHSVLIHGFSAMAGADPVAILDLYDRCPQESSTAPSRLPTLVALIRKDQGEESGTRRLRIARSMPFGAD